MASAQRIQNDQKISDSKSKMVDALKKLDADQEVLSIEMRGRLDKDEAAIKMRCMQNTIDHLQKFSQSLLDQIAELADQVDVEGNALQDKRDGAQEH